MEATESLEALIPGADNDNADLYCSPDDENTERTAQHAQATARRLFDHEDDGSDPTTIGIESAPLGTLSEHQQDADTDVDSVCGSDVTAATVGSQETVVPSTQLTTYEYGTTPTRSTSNRTLVHRPANMYSPFPRPTVAERRAQGRRMGTGISPASSASNLTRPFPFRERAQAQGETGDSSPDKVKITLLEALAESAATPPTAFRRYNIPASNNANATSSLSLSPLALRQNSHNNQSSRPQFHGHLVRSATQPIAARMGNEHRIEGLRDVTMRLGPNALPSRGTLAPARLRPHNDSNSVTIVASATTTNVPPTTVSAVNRTPTTGLAQPTTAIDTATFRARTADYISTLLQQTRARGALLPTVQRSDLTAPEITWRDANADLIRSIYGRDDVVLSETERGFLDRVATEMAGSVGREEWMKELFRAQE